MIKRHFSRFKSLVAGAITVTGLIVASAGQASAFTYAFDGRSSSSNSTATGASATVDFDFIDVGSGQVQLNLEFTNTTGTLSSGMFGSGATDAKLTGITFDLFDDVTVDAFSVNGKLDTFKEDVSFRPFSNRVGKFDVAFADNNNFVGGNANGALAAGESSLATLLLSAPEDATNLRQRFRLAFENNELDIAARFQQVNAGAGSDKLLGGSVDPFNPPPKDIPEPAALGGLGLLLGFLGVRRKYR